MPIYIVSLIEIHFKFYCILAGRTRERVPTDSKSNVFITGSNLKQNFTSHVEQFD